MTHTLGRPDFDVIAGWIEPGHRVLDLGCGDGSLLKHLQETRGVRGVGVEIEDANIVAAIGPCIAQASYEVDGGFRERVLAEQADNARFFVPGAPDKWQFDLEGYVAARLERAEIGGVERLSLDTYADEARFFSFRRATHRGEADYGRQMSLIGLA